MARYMERTENLARLIEVNEVFVRDRRGSHNWEAILRLNADFDAFTKRYGEPTEQSVAYFYMLDPEHPGSIYSAVKAARENARTLRPFISTEMWTHLNGIYNRLRTSEASPDRLPNISDFCTRMKHDCQAHNGITEGTFYRDQGWAFYQLGKYLERADQTTRLIDVKYHALLPSPQDVGSPLDQSQWNALLRSVAGYHAYRRIQPRDLSPTKVAAFMLLNQQFPRSVRYCVAECSRNLATLITTFQLPRGIEVTEPLDVLHQRLEESDIEGIIAQGLHEFLDTVQVELIEVSRAMGRAYFGEED
jgi:uncharacterized alpha-E superfamily protein